MTPTLFPADIVFVQGDRWISRAIRWRTRGRGEEPTVVNHVGLVVSQGDVKRAQVIEALFSGVQKRTLAEGYAGKPDRISVYRPLNLTARDYEIICARAERYVGRRYGWGKILGQLIGVPGLVDRWPVCSWVVAVAYGFSGYYFGVSPKVADPDDIHDFCVSRPDRYERIRELAPIPG